MLSIFSIFTDIKIGSLPEIIRFLRYLLTDVENKKSVVVTLRSRLWLEVKKKLIDCGVRNGLQRIM